VLRIRFDTARRVLHFSGPSTYHAKEAIKRLGNARFLGDQKAWEVSAFSGNADELRTLFGEFQTEIEITATEGMSQPAGSREAGAREEAPSMPAAMPTPEGSPSVPAGISVPQLIATAKGALERAFAGGALVYGVISAVKLANGRAFVTLNDPGDRTISVNCVMWSGIDQVQEQLAGYGFKLEADLEVMFHVSIGLNSKNGNLSLRINRVIPEYTLSKLLGERDKTNKRLKDEGIFDRNKQLPLPRLLTRVGVLTSAGGTVIHDFCGALERAHFGFELFWVPVAVQGKDARRSILRGFELLSARDDLDAILIFRGGGSTGDLAVFNTYEVAKAICLAPLPVLSAIGHQEDHCSAQDVSHRSFGVPRDIGNFMADLVLELRDQLRRFSERIISGGDAALSRAEMELKHAADALLQRSVRAVERASERISTLVGKLDAQGTRHFERTVERVTRIGGTLRLASERVLQRAEEKISSLGGIPRAAELLIERKTGELSRLSAHVSEASPEVQLKRGFSIVKAGGAFVRSAAELKKNDEVSLEFIDGKRDAKILDS